LEAVELRHEDYVGKWNWHVNRKPSEWRQSVSLPLSNSAEDRVSSDTVLRRLAKGRILSRAELTNGSVGYGGRKKLTIG